MQSLRLCQDPVHVSKIVFWKSPLRSVRYVLCSFFWIKRGFVNVNDIPLKVREKEYLGEQQLH
jgi:hypothetical protein